jgi:hypothetical protein
MTLQAGEGRTGPVLLLAETALLFAVSRSRSGRFAVFWFGLNWKTASVGLAGSG